MGDQRKDVGEDLPPGTVHTAGVALLGERLGVALEGLPVQQLRGPQALEKVIVLLLVESLCLALIELLTWELVGPVTATTW